MLRSVSELSPLHERWLTEVCVHAALGEAPRQQSIQVFRNPFMDRWLGRTHPAVPALLFSPLIVASAFFAHSRLVLWGWVGAFLGGLLGLTLLEYLLHRFVLHRRVGPDRASRIAAFLHHGYHHVYPNDEGRLVLPPMVTLPFAVVVFAVYALVLPTGVAAAAFAGTATGYVAYDSMHWWLHHGRARSRVGRWLKRYHLLHHHHQEGGRFGVSSPLWDLVFGTYVRTKIPAAARAQRSRTRALVH